MPGRRGPEVTGVHAVVSVLKHTAVVGTGADFIICPSTIMSSGGTAVRAPGTSTGTLVSCPYGDHSVTTMSGPGETTCATT